MTDDTPTDEAGDDLRARLRAADPAAGSPPPSDRWIAELTEATMSAPHDTETRATAEDRSHRRRLWAMPAAAAVVVTAVGLAVVLGRSGNDPAPSAGPAALPSSPSAQTSSSPAAAVSLTAGPAVVEGRCLPVSVSALQRMMPAFDGTVTALDGQVATLQVSRWYAATPAQRATDVVEVQGMSPQLQELVNGVDLQVGGRYLVTASRGAVTACGFSAAWSPRLAGLYAEAFAG